MKTFKLYAALVITAMTLASCDEQYGDAKMHTTVNTDGSCTREINFKTPKPSGIALGAEWIEIPDDSDSLTATFTRNFDNAEQMSQDMPLISNGKPLESKATLDKKFRWFYTEYTFTETFASTKSNFLLQPTDYADSIEVSYWFSGQPDITIGMNGAEALERLNSIGEKMDKWMYDDLTQSGMNFIQDNYNVINNPPVNRQEFMQLSDSLADFLREQCNNKIFELDHKKSFQEFFNSDAYSIFFDDNTQTGKNFEKHLAPHVNFSALSVQYTLSMPGKVVDAGNGNLHDGIIEYPLSGERLIPADYIITATSRQTNIWAYIISAVVIILAIGSWIWKRKQAPNI